MSLIENDRWQEHCYENFVESLQMGNYAMAKDCIADMFDVNPEQARAMSLELREAPIEPFMQVSPIQRWNL